MGTRSITRVYDIDGECLVAMYRQFDGYPSGHGEELARFLVDKRLVNGIGHGDNAGNSFNGMGDLAAQMVYHFKEGKIGGFYLHSPKQDEEWTYEIRPNNKELKWGQPVGKVDITVKNYRGDQVFHGDVNEFIGWIDKGDAER